MKVSSNVGEQFSVAALKRCIDNKTKPLGSLGRIEELALQIGSVQKSLQPKMRSCHLIIFAGDHGIVESGVSAYPQEVTQQMVLNFLNGGAAANVFATTLEIDIQVVDAGVAGDPIDHPDLVQRRLGPGTANFLSESAMSSSQYELAMQYGQELSVAHDCDAVCFGDMGIGNTSSATLIAHKLLGLPLDDLTGCGTGLSDSALKHKKEILRAAAKRTPDNAGVEAALTEYGGFEIVMMTGAMLGAAAADTIIIVDGFIASAAAAAAIEHDSSVRDKMIFAHLSAERGHQSVVDAIGVKPLLDLNMRLGEGTGALLAWPLLKSAAAMLRDMASFESAGVSEAE